MLHLSTYLNFYLYCTDLLSNPFIKLQTLPFHSRILAIHSKLFLMYASRFPSVKLIISNLWNHKIMDKLRVGWKLKIKNHIPDTMQIFNRVMFITKLRLLKRPDVTYWQFINPTLNRGLNTLFLYNLFFVEKERFIVTILNSTN